jgi:hypothetical protein
VRSRCRTGRLEKWRADQRPVADVDVTDPAGCADERRGEFGYLVDDELRSPPVDDRLEVLSSGHELKIGEDLGQEELALGADQLIETWESGCPFAPKAFVGSSTEGVEPGLPRPTRIRLACTASGTSGSKWPASGRLVNNIRVGGTAPSSLSGLVWTLLGYGGRRWRVQLLGSGGRPREMSLGEEGRHQLVEVIWALQREDV